MAQLHRDNEPAEGDVTLIELLIASGAAVVDNGTEGTSITVDTLLDLRSIKLEVEVGLADIFVAFDGQTTYLRVVGATLNGRHLALVPGQTLVAAVNPR